MCTIRFVEASGFHCKIEHRLWVTSGKIVIGLWSLKYQTIVVPIYEVDTSICWTFWFQDKNENSPWAADPTPFNGGKWVGAIGSRKLKIQVKIDENALRNTIIFRALTSGNQEYPWI